MGGSIMKKDQNNRDSAIIIPFPGLKDRYYEKGVSSLEAHQFQEAVDLLKQAYQMDSTDPQISAAYLAALYENGDYHDSRQMAEELLKSGVGSFYDVLDIYLMILIQLNDYQQVVSTLKPLFEENEIPPEKAEHFLQLLQLSEKAARNQGVGNSANIEEETSFIHQEQSSQDQLIALGMLKDKNIHPYLDSLIDMLSAKKVHPFIKTVILTLLQENKIDQFILVEKFDVEKTLSPIELPSVEEIPFFLTVKEQVENELRDHNPVLLEQILDMIKRHSYCLYPFEWEPVNPSVWAAAYRAMGYEIYGESWNSKKLAEFYDIGEEELSTTFAFILKLEEISSTIV